MNYERRIEKGMALLDKRLPDWEKGIDLDKLSLTSPCRCVLGQLALSLDPEARIADQDERFGVGACKLFDDAHYWAESINHGFLLDSWENSPSDWGQLTKAWKAAIRKRLEARTSDHV